MDYKQYSLDWLKNRLLKFYSQEYTGDNINEISDHIAHLDVQFLINSGILDFNDLNLTEHIAEILGLEYKLVKDNQINNIVQFLSIEELNTRIRNLPENVGPDEIIKEKIKQVVLSDQDPRVPRNLTIENFPIMKYLRETPRNEFHQYLN